MAGQSSWSAPLASQGGWSVPLVKQSDWSAPLANQNGWPAPLSSQRSGWSVQGRPGPWETGDHRQRWFSQDSLEQETDEEYIDSSEEYLQLETDNQSGWEEAAKRLPSSSRTWPGPPGGGQSHSGSDSKQRHRWPKYRQDKDILHGKSHHDWSEEGQLHGWSAGDSQESEDATLGYDRSDEEQQESGSDDAHTDLDHRRRHSWWEEGLPPTRSDEQQDIGISGESQQQDESAEGQRHGGQNVSIYQIEGKQEVDRDDPQEQDREDLLTAVWDAMEQRLLNQSTVREMVTVTDVTEEVTTEEYYSDIPDYPANSSSSNSSSQTRTKRDLDREDGAVGAMTTGPSGRSIDTKSVTSWDKIRLFFAALKRRLKL